MNQDKILELAKYIYDGEKNRHDILKISTAENLTPEISYLIQDQLIKLREEDGYKVYAPKMGLTSKAKWEQMGVDSPIVGYVFEDMIEKTDVIHVSDYIHPKVEPEIAIVMKNEISGSNLTIDDVLKNVDYVLSCAEIIDSRYKDFDFTLTDVIADNTSASGAIFSPQKYSVEDMKLDTEEVIVRVNGDIVVEGNGSAVLGNPAAAIVELAGFLDKKGQSVPVGVPIMTGGLTSAVLIKAGDSVEISYSNLETINFKVK